MEPFSFVFWPLLKWSSWNWFIFITFQKYHRPMNISSLWSSPFSIVSLLYLCFPFALHPENITLLFGKYGLLDVMTSLGLPLIKRSTFGKRKGICRLHPIMLVFLGSSGFLSCYASQFMLSEYHSYFSKNGRPRGFQHKLFHWQHWHQHLHQQQHLMCPRTKWMMSK